MKKPEVKLISKQNNILEVLYTACRTCYSNDSPLDIMYNLSDKNPKLDLIKKVISSGHHSTLEHIQFTWAVDGISRACSHQLVRHRHMSFSQKSQRYVKGFADVVTPKAIQNNEQAMLAFCSMVEYIDACYTRLIELGIKPEDARAILPNATTTSMVVSCNLRELIFVAGLRLCTRAQLEIRTLIQAMCNAVIEQEPWLKEYLVPKCERLGYCDEDKCCGRKEKLNEK